MTRRRLDMHRVREAVKRLEAEGRQRVRSLGPLDPVARRVLECMAEKPGVGCTATSIGAMLGLPEAEAQAAIDRLVTAGLVDMPEKARASRADDVLVDPDAVAAEVLMATPMLERPTLEEMGRLLRRPTHQIREVVDHILESLREVGPIQNAPQEIQSLHEALIDARVLDLLAAQGAGRDSLEAAVKGCGLTADETGDCLLRLRDRGLAKRKE